MSYILQMTWCWWLKLLPHFPSANVFSLNVKHFQHNGQMKVINKNMFSIHCYSTPSPGSGKFTLLSNPPIYYSAQNSHTCTSWEWKAHFFFFFFVFFFVFCFFLFCFLFCFVLFFIIAIYYNHFFFFHYCNILQCPKGITLLYPRPPS